MNLKNFFKIRVKKKINFYILILLIVIFSIGGYVHNNNISFIVMFFIFSIGLLSFGFGRKVIAQTKVKLLDCKGFANQETKCKLLVEYPFKREILTLNKIFYKRGYNVFRFVLKSNFPFNLVEFEKEVNFKVLIYPEIKGKSLEEFKSGIEIDEFEDLKRYEGENISRIHWASVAKGELMVKKFGEKDSESELVFDINKLSGDKEKRISQITKWVVEAKQKNMKFKVVLDKEYKDFNEILEKLALY